MLLLAPFDLSWLARCSCMLIMFGVFFPEGALLLSLLASLPTDWRLMIDRKSRSSSSSLA